MKAQIAIEFDIPTGSFRLVSRGKKVTASDETQLLDCLTFTDAEYLVFVSEDREPGAKAGEVTVTFIRHGGPRGTSFLGGMTHATQLGALKDAIVRTFGIPMPTFRIVSRGRYITDSDDTPLHECLAFRDGGYSAIVLDIKGLPVSEGGHLD